MHTANEDGQLKMRNVRHSGVSSTVYIVQDKYWNLKFHAQHHKHIKMTLNGSCNTNLLQFLEYFRTL
jgi:hypothetical protein